MPRSTTTAVRPAHGLGCCRRIRARGGGGRTRRSRRRPRPRSRSFSRRTPRRSGRCRWARPQRGRAVQRASGCPRAIGGSSSIRPAWGTRETIDGRSTGRSPRCPAVPGSPEALSSGTSAPGGAARSRRTRAARPGATSTSAASSDARHRWNAAAGRAANLDRGSGHVVRRPSSSPRNRHGARPHRQQRAAAAPGHAHLKDRGRADWLDEVFQLGSRKLAPARPPRPRAANHIHVPVLGRADRAGVGRACVSAAREARGAIKPASPWYGVRRHPAKKRADPGLAWPGSTAPPWRRSSGPTGLDPRRSRRSASTTSRGRPAAPRRRSRSSCRRGGCPRRRAADAPPPPARHGEPGPALDG